MKPAWLDLHMIAGTTFRRKLSLRLNGQPMDLTGYVARLQANSSSASTASPILALSSETGGIQIIGATGEISIEQTNEETASLPPGIYPYGLDLLTPTAEKWALLLGNLVVCAGQVS